MNIPAYKTCLKKTTICVAVLAAISSQALANDSNKDTKTEKEKFEVIEVTTQKRVENAQKVPIALTAFSEETLRKLGAQNINDIGGSTPGLDTTSRSITQPKIGIRGLTNNSASIGSESNIVVYQDNVYSGRTGAATVNFNDIERIEVLKGPQGTLFGKNAAAGAVVITTKLPSEDFEANYRATLGNYNKRKIEGLVNIPLSDDVYFRASAVVNKRDGFLDGNQFDDPYFGDEPASDDFVKTKFLNEDNMSLRTALLWDTTDKLSVLARAEYSEVDQDARPAYSVNPEFYRGEGTGIDPMGTYETDFDNKEGRKLFAASIEVNYDFPIGQLTSITAYKTYETYNHNEEDGTAHPKVYFNDLNDEEMDYFSQEIRLSNADDLFKWTVGASYSKEELKQTNTALLSSNTIDAYAVNQALLMNGLPPEGLPQAGIPGVADTPAGMGIAGLLQQLMPKQFAQLSQATGIPQGQLALMIGQHNLDKPWQEHNHNTGENVSYGIFADGTYNVTDALRLTAGLRYSKDEKDFTWLSHYQNQVDMPIPGLPAIPFGFRFQTQNYLADEAGAPVLDADGNYQSVGKSDSWSQLTSRFVADYQFNDDVMAFISYAEGYKAGGFNATRMDKSVEQEDVSNIEIGLKSTLLNDTLRLNMSAFDYDYDNFQLRVLVLEGALPQYSTMNVDLAGLGYELSSSWYATEDLMLTLNYSHTETEILSQSVVEETVDIVGMALPNAPEDKLYAAVDYFHELDNGVLNFHLNYTDYSERTFIDQTAVAFLPKTASQIEQLTSENNLPSYGIANMRVTYSSDDNWELAVYANNLFDEEYLMQPVRGPGDQAGSPEIKGVGKPLMFGIEFSQFF